MSNRVKTRKAERRAAKKVKSGERGKARKTRKHALHEAGHIVCAYIFGVPVHYAQVDHDTGYTHAMGATWFENPHGPLLREEKAIRLMVENLAGLAAELGPTVSLKNAPAEAMSAARSDLEAFRVLFGKLGLTRTTTYDTYFTMLDRVREEAVQLLHACSQSLSTVADRLAEKGRLGAPELNALLDTAVDVVGARAAFVSEERSRLMLEDLKGILAAAGL